MASRLMTLYGKTIPGTDASKAIQWYRMAATASDRSEDDALRVWVCGRAAIALGYEGACLPLASSFADQALAISDKPSLGMLNAVVAKAHVAAIRGNARSANRLLEQARREFDAAGSEEQQSHFAIPEWRMAVFSNLLLARLGEERRAIVEQEVAMRSLPSSLPRFATHIELHRGLMLARAGDRTEGVEALGKHGAGPQVAEAHHLSALADYDQRAAELGGRLVDVNERAVVVSGLDEPPRYLMQHALGYQVHDMAKPHHHRRHGRAGIGWAGEATEA